MEDLPFVCRFGTDDDPDMCLFAQDPNDDLDWELIGPGPTLTSGTGPRNETLDKYGIFCSLVYIQSRSCLCTVAVYILGPYARFSPVPIDGKVFKSPDKGQLISPNFPEKYHGQKKCLVFTINAWGIDIGEFKVFDQNDKLLQTYFFYKTHFGWQTKYLNLNGYVSLFVLSASTGSETGISPEGDMCVDNLFLLLGECSKFKLH